MPPLVDCPNLRSTMVLAHNKEFDYMKWHWEILRAQVSLKTLSDYASDRNALAAHFEGVWEISSIDADGARVTKKAADSEHCEEILNTIEDEIHDAILTLRRQSVALIVSVVESALAEALRVVFHQRPTTMNSIKDFQAIARLEDIDSADDLKTVRAMIIERAVSAATMGKFNSPIKNLCAVTDQKFDRRLQDEFSGVIELRNEIIHEHHRVLLERKTLDSMFETGMSMIKEIGRVLHTANLPVLDQFGVFSEHVDVVR